MVLLLTICKVLIGNPLEFCLAVVYKWKKQEPRKLKRSIGLWSAVAINVGAIIGGGIFVVTGIVAGYAGSALVVSMVIAGIIAFITAWSFAKLTAWQPVEGGVYEYGRQLVSPYAGFLAGWMWLVANTFTGAAVSLGFAYYLTAAFPSLPTGIVAAVLCLAFTALNLVGARESTRVNNVLVAIKLAVLAFFVVFGSLHVNARQFQSVCTPLKRCSLWHILHLFCLRRLCKSLGNCRGSQRCQTKRSSCVAFVFGNFDGSLCFGGVGCCWVTGSCWACWFLFTFERGYRCHGKFTCSANCCCWRFGGYRKRVAHCDSGGFPHGIFYGKAQRFALRFSSVTQQVFDTLLCDFS